MRNHVQLIAYADRLGGSLAGLQGLLDTDLKGVFNGVHILPFFTPFDGVDAGFDPVDHTEVDARLGSWDDVRALANTHDVVVDVIVNHVSADSAQFRDVVAHGRDSRWFEMFLTMDKVFPDGARESDLLGVYRPRPGLPLIQMTLGDEPHLVWTTFTPQQIDVDVRSELTRDYLRSILDALAAAGVTMIRMDAVGYAVKTPGTTSFMTPETFAFIEELRVEAAERGMQTLVEVHSYYKRQVEIAALVDCVYDFALPPLVLHAAHSGDHEPLLRWLEVRPTNAVTVLDTHDGIGIVDVGSDPDTGEAGLLDDQQLDALVESIHDATGGTSRLATGAAASNLDLYQVNSTFFDALGSDDRRYLAARAVQYFTPGVPQVYYVGAFAGGNDTDLLEQSGVGRDINRHRYTPEDLQANLTRPVVAAGFELARFRNTFDVFNGSFTAARNAETNGLILSWTDGPRSAALTVDLQSGDVTLAWSDGEQTGRVDDLLTAGAWSLRGAGAAARVARHPRSGV
ncbi:sucrose phosphorylase [Cryobacterium sp. SO1]|uniref:sucrose phosphorylase n=1 Tax=Cryobacterium sp. SO1 TaxID=1897061 RepID=UPI001023DE40|nr:sucrose phosphorylase [Cryobacterium sp. SO1]RZI37557.1 Sucrose 6(F)-phosphate phosphorylase [Cryobacterium sp. SO1]